jgi:hypothetical protein
MSIFTTEVVVIGAGPVGLFAVFECGMLKLNCHVIDALSMIGGQCAALYPEKPIYDIPAHPQITGEGLIENLKLQIEPFNPTYHLGQQVTTITLTMELTVDRRHIWGHPNSNPNDYHSSRCWGFWPDRPLRMKILKAKAFITMSDPVRLIATKHRHRRRWRRLWLGYLFKRSSCTFPWFTVAPNSGQPRK